MPGGFGLLLAREQPDVEAGFSRGGDEVGAVRRVADGGGGDALDRLHIHMLREQRVAAEREKAAFSVLGRDAAVDREAATEAGRDLFVEDHRGRAGGAFVNDDADRVGADVDDGGRSEEHTSELKSLMRISYAVFCL